MSTLTRLAGIGFAVAALGFAATGCGDDLKDKIDEAKTTYSDAKTTYEDTKDAIDSATVKGSAANSFYKASNLTTGLRKINDKAGDDAIAVTIYPGYLQADVSTGSETAGKRYRVNTDGDAKESNLKLNGPGKVAENVFPFADVDPAAVESTVSAAAKKAGKTVDDVSYVNIRIGVVSGKPEMNIYVNGGEFYTANLDGSGLKSAVGKAKEAAGDAQDAVGKAQETADCIKDAGTDVDKLQACAK